MQSSTVDFSVIREKISVDWFFQNHMQAKPKSLSSGTRYSTCPKCGGAASEHSVRCSVRGPKWNCFRCGAKGDIVDAAGFFWDLPLNEAAKRLGEAASVVPEHVHKPKLQEAIKPKNYEAIQKMIFKLLDAQQEVDEQVSRYLVEVRKIPPRIVHNAVIREMIVTLPSKPEDAFRYLRNVVGESLLKESGLWKEGSRICAASFRPLGLVSSDATSIEFKSIGASKEGTAKSIRCGDPRPWLWKGTERGYFITEGFVDLLTALAMGVKRNIKAFPGGNNWQTSDLDDMRGKNVICAFDNDMTGNQGSEKIREYLTTIGATFSRYELPADTDLNKVYVRSTQ